MTITSTYLLKIAENHTIEISQDELRSLLGEIEAELHRSTVYRRAVARLQKLLGSSSEQAKILFKAVGREAIGLAFQQFAQHQQVADIHQHSDVATNVEQENTSDLSSCIASVKLHSLKNSANTSNESVALPPQVATNTTTHPAKNSENSTPVATVMKWLKPNKKPSKTEIAKQIAAEQRLEQLRQIAQQLKQARESQNLSLSQLNIYTHIPIHQMEAVENCSAELLAEDVIVRGFIRLMGNALGLNGTILAASLPAPDTVKSVLPSWSESKNISGKLAVDIRPMHLYVGYTALVAGAVGGLSLLSQQANADRALNPDSVIPPSSSLSQSSQKSEPTAKPGLKSSHIGVSVGTDIAPPEVL
ncbi:helix-turn-helix domain-containing protein [Dendronalium sp. ChiSLP03b]|uniref:helix-turn-helix domain-containing protein n=1 Tax=Dendronalium sp. ChiSLP03b TaxID=3075381 RepID=UPI002AD4F88B|nr:helix-turn-helix domain-containing protein [Dendronalium sp. ChiSLP03b]MDZ8207609.1 helix-turn-helix domain-containing protein [Dendronalium sp. ChiSLP03b]